MAYQYYKGRYYIGNVKGRLSINPHCQSVHFEHEFRKFMVNTRIDDCEISNDNYDIGKAYMSFFHELTHLFQDFSLTACINEKIFKRIFGEEYIINNFTKFELDDGTKIKLGNLRLLYTDLYEKGVVIEDDITNIFLKKTNIVHGSTPHSHLSYEDLLESYAEIKSWQTILAENEWSELNCQFFKHLMEMKMPKIEGDFNDNSLKLSFDFDDRTNGFVTMYRIVRIFFIRFFQLKNSKFLNLNDKLFKNERIEPITYADFLLFYGNISPKYKSSAGCQNITISDKTYVQLEYQLLKYILLALDIALTIPGPHYILNSIVTGANRVEDFNPCIRFISILEYFNKHADYICNIINKDTQWVSLFYDIASYFHWPTYEVTIESVLDEIYYYYDDSIISSIQEDFLNDRFFTNMEETNGSLLTVLKNKKLPLIVEINDKMNKAKYLDILRFIDNNIQESIETISNKHFEKYYLRDDYKKTRLTHYGFENGFGYVLRHNPISEDMRKKIYEDYYNNCLIELYGNSTNDSIFTTITKDYNANLCPFNSGFNSCKNDKCMYSSLLSCKETEHNSCLLNFHVNYELNKILRRK